MIRLRPEERPAVTAYIHSICAVTLGQNKDYLIEGRLGSVLEETGCTSFTDLIHRARADMRGNVNRRIIDEITTNETLFFRDTTPFELLRHKIIPEIIDRRTRSSVAVPLRIWSAACSTGQEIYSIAILLQELLGDLSRYNIRLIGTDISDQAISRASRGIFSLLEIERGLSPAERDKSFVPHPSGWKIRDEIRALVSFRRMNLMDDLSPLGKFDVVFCRNVAIYFSEADRISLFSRIGRSLEADGCLVIGAMESITGICPQFESKRHLRSVFYQLRRV